MSYTQIFYHIVFSTKNRLPVITEPHRHELYNYLWGILKNKKCHLHQMGGVEDHIHILTSVNSTLSLSELMRDLKASSSCWIKKGNLFPEFCGWQSEYGAFTKSFSNKKCVVEYIRNQQIHHQNESSVDEFKRLLREEGISFDEKYLR